MSSLVDDAASVGRRAMILGPLTLLLIAAAEPTLAQSDAPVATLFDRLAAGGAIAVVQGVVSVAGVAVIIERVLNLRRSRVIPDDLPSLIDHWRRTRDLPALRAAVERKPSILGRAMVDVLSEERASRAEVVSRAVETARPMLKRQLQRAYPLAVVATLEPLLGLLGTVWGLIGAFDAVGREGRLGDPRLFADDIALALVTTALGLAIAIPMLAFYHNFRNRTQGLTIDLELEVSRLADAWSEARSREREAGA